MLSFIEIGWRQNCKHSAGVGSILHHKEGQLVCRENVAAQNLSVKYFLDAPTHFGCIK